MSLLDRITVGLTVTDTAFGERRSRADPSFQTIEDLGWH